jgi:hypothetical protein
MHLDCGRRASVGMQWVLAVLVAVVAGTSFAASGGVLPANAHLSAYATGWECSRGYRRANETCEAVEVPANAYLNFSGAAWDCNRGYRKIDQGCKPVTMPADAHADDEQFGSGWQCNRGYRTDQEGCAAMKVPTHGFLLDPGDDWGCERGFTKRASAIQLPINSYLDAQDFMSQNGSLRTPAAFRGASPL